MHLRQLANSNVELYPLLAPNSYTRLPRIQMLAPMKLLERLWTQLKCCYLAWRLVAHHVPTLLEASSIWAAINVESSNIGCASATDICSSCA